MATSATALAAPAAAPSNFVLTAPFVTVLHLAWQDNSTDETGFEVSYRVGTSGNFTIIGTTYPDTTTVTLTGASAGTTYQFQVRSVSTGPEYSAYAGPATITTPTWQGLPALQAPSAGAALASRTLSTGNAATVVPLAGLFTDPDVSSAARLTTDLGVIDFAFFPNAAPLTVANFLGYLNRGDFLNTIFHRSVPGFIIQAGAFHADATASAVVTLPPIENEPGISNVRGTVAMARSSAINSATNQFFINLANNSQSGFNNLDTGTYSNNGFTVFARVAGTGMAVADAIAALPVRNYSTINGALTDTPVRGTPPATYDPSTLVRILAASPVSPLTLSASVSNPNVLSATVLGTDLTLTPLLPGVATISLTATDLDNQTATSTFTVTVLDSYAGWAARQAFATPADALPAADPDRDGRTNLLEFALATAPLTPNAGDLVAALVGNHFTYTFPLRPNLSGITVALQSAEDCNGPWATRWTQAEGLLHPWIASHQVLAGTEWITARDPVPLSGPRQFLRLQVTQP